MKTCLRGFWNLYKNKHKIWSRYWKLDGRYLTEAEAKKFCQMGIAHGYECDTDVPDELVRKWIGWDKEGGKCQAKARQTTCL